MVEDMKGITGRVGDDVHARIDEAAESVKRGASAAADRAEDGAHRAADAGARGAHRATDKAAAWERRGASAASGAQDYAENLFDCTCQFVREKPLESIALALAAGWLAGRVLASRR